MVRTKFEPGTCRPRLELCAVTPHWLDTWSARTMNWRRRGIAATFAVIFIRTDNIHRIAQSWTTNQQQNRPHGLDSSLTGDSRVIKTESRVTPTESRKTENMATLKSSTSRENYGQFFLETIRGNFTPTGIWKTSDNLAKKLRVGFVQKYVKSALVMNTFNMLRRKLLLNKKISRRQREKNFPQYFRKTIHQWDSSVIHERDPHFINEQDTWETWLT